MGSSSTRTTNYARGVYAERRLKRYLERQGWFVVRSAGSRGVADLVALRWDAALCAVRVWLIQVKRGAVDLDEPNVWRLARTLEGCLGVARQVWVYRGRGRWEVHPLGAERQPLTLVVFDAA